MNLFRYQKVTGQGHQAVTKIMSYRPNKKAYEVQTWYTYGARRPISPTSAMTSKVKGQGRDVT